MVLCVRFCTITEAIKFQDHDFVAKFTRLVLFVVVMCPPFVNKLPRMGPGL